MPERRRRAAADRCPEVPGRRESDFFVGSTEGRRCAVFCPATTVLDPFRSPNGCRPPTINRGRRGGRSRAGFGPEYRHAGRVRCVPPLVFDPRGFPTPQRS